MNWLETTAHAAEAGATTDTGLINIIMLVGFVAIFYFLLWRPQSKRRKEHQTLMGGLNNGDEVVTAGGLVGQIEKVEDDFVKLKVANNITFRIQKSSIAATLPKGTLKSLGD